MRIGTKSVLFGVHAFWLHPFFVAAAWRKLYGLPRDWRVWLAFIVHDWGYWGCSDMDGKEGERHPFLGARIMLALTGGDERWYWFALLHSRFLAKSMGVQVSRLCLADKLSFKLTPAWLYWILSKLTGELDEYLERARAGKYAREDVYRTSYRAWREAVSSRLDSWIAEIFAQIDDSHLVRPVAGLDR